jgi:hypothetical protein
VEGARTSSTIKTSDCRRYFVLPFDETQSTNDSFLSCDDSLHDLPAATSPSNRILLRQPVLSTRWDADSCHHHEAKMMSSPSQRNHVMLVVFV